MLLKEDNEDGRGHITFPQISHIAYRQENTDSWLEINNSLPHGNWLTLMAAI